MKKKLFLLPFLALGLMFAACDKDNTNTNNNGGGNGQAMTLNLNFNQIEGWLGQSYEYVANQLIQMGFTLDEEDYKEKGSYFFMKIDYNTMSGYECNIHVSDEEVVDRVFMIYEAANASSTFGNTVANFKKYAVLQNQTYANLMPLYGEGVISYRDNEEEEFTGDDYESYAAMEAALNNLTPHNECEIGWGQAFSTGFAAETMAGYENSDDEGSIMMIGILVMQQSSDSDER